MVLNRNATYSSDIINTVIYVRNIAIYWRIQLDIYCAVTFRNDGNNYV